MTSYSISEMAKATGLTPHTLRYYEKELLLFDVGRNSAGRRCYTDEHVLAMKFVITLRETGMTIETIKKYIELFREGEHTSILRLQLLEQHEQDVLQQLAETKSNLALIRKKIRMYRDSLA